MLVTQSRYLLKSSCRSRPMLKMAPPAPSIDKTCRGRCPKGTARRVSKRDNLARSRRRAAQVGPWGRPVRTGCVVGNEPHWFLPVKRPLKALAIAATVHWHVLNACRAFKSMPAAHTRAATLVRQRGTPCPQPKLCIPAVTKRWTPHPRPCAADPTPCRSRTSGVERAWNAPWLVGGWVGGSDGRVDRGGELAVEGICFHMKHMKQEPTLGIRHWNLLFPTRDVSPSSPSSPPLLTPPACPSHTGDVVRVVRVESFQCAQNSWPKEDHIILQAVQAWLVGRRPLTPFATTAGVAVATWPPMCVCIKGKPRHIEAPHISEKKPAKVAAERPGS